MDIGAALGLLGQATSIVKNLRDIDKGFDVAALKSQMAELYSALADVRMGLSDARETIHDKDKRIKELEDKIAELTSGALCEKCHEGRMKMTGSGDHSVFGVLGVRERTYECDNCGHIEHQMQDSLKK